MKRRNRIRFNPRKRRNQQKQDQICLLLIGIVVIVLMALNTYADYSNWVCREVPNHYSCE